jgi:hypothetical protein
LVRSLIILSVGPNHPFDRWHPMPRVRSYSRRFMKMPPIEKGEGEMAMTDFEKFEQILEKWFAKDDIDS